MEAWREELYHHGILGQKWGIRRYQNEDGSLTELGKRRIVADMKRRKDRFILGKNDGPIDKNAYEAVHDRVMATNGTKITKLKDELDESSKEFREFWAEGNEGTRDKYFTIAGCVEGLRIGLDPSNKSDRGEFANIVSGYKYNDFDQGLGNSFELYLLDKGISPHDYASKNMKAEKAYLDEVETSVGNILGGYGDFVLNDYSKFGFKSDTVNSVIAKTIKEKDAQWAYLELDMPKSEEKTYKQLINKAKKFSGEYEKLSNDELMQIWEESENHLGD